MKALVTAPVFDDVTPHSYRWSREAKSLLESAYEVVDLSGGIVSRKDVEEILPDVDLFAFYDHGSEDALFGSQYLAVVDLANVQLLTGKDCYTMACSSAKILGVQAHKIKARSYWGYYDPFSFTTDALDEFQEFANCGLKFRLQGLSWSDCLKKAKELGYRLAEELSRAGKYVASVLMRQDTDILRCYDGETPPAEPCRVSRLIVKLFGYGTLTRLRRVRDKILLRSLQ